MTGTVTFSVAVGGDGSTVTDDDNAETGLRDGGYQTRFVPALTQMVAVAQTVVSSAADVEADRVAVVAAAADVTGAGSVGPLVSGTSTTSLTIGTGSKTLTTQAGKAWVVGSRVRLADSTAVNLMDGEVTAYSTTSLTVEVDRVEGSGTIASWTITYVGPAGPATLSYLQEGQSTGAPNATVYVSRLSATGAATNIDAALLPKGSGAVLAAVPDNTSTGGNKRGANAVDLQTSRSAAASVASGASAVLAGGSSNTASGANSVVSGGDTNAASAQYATVAGGYTNTASAIGATVLGGGNNEADGLYSTVSGRWATSRGVQGADVYGGGQFAESVGATQIGRHLLIQTTTDATPTRVTVDAGVASAANQPILPNTSTYHARIRVVAHCAGGPYSKSWTGTALIRRGANAAATAVIGSPTLASDFGDAGLSSASVAVTADTSYGTLAITATGIAATTIVWLAEIENLELDV